MNGTIFRTKVATSWLLDKLRENRAQHEATYQEAVSNYKDKVREELEKAWTKCEEAAAPVNLSFRVDKPTHYLNGYDVAISMIENHTEDHIAIDTNRYQEWVLDDWSWKGTFKTSMSYYNDTPADPDYDDNF